MTTRTCTTRSGPKASSCRSASLEYRRTLLEERRHTFLVIFGLEQLTEVGADPYSELGPVRIERGSKSLLQPSDGQRWVRSNDVGPFERDSK